MRSRQSQCSLICLTWAQWQKAALLRGSYSFHDYINASLRCFENVAAITCIKDPTEKFLAHVNCYSFFKIQFTKIILLFSSNLPKRLGSFVRTTKGVLPYVISLRMFPFWLLSFSSQITIQLLDLGTISITFDRGLQCVYLNNELYSMILLTPILLAWRPLSYAETSVE